MFHPSFFFNDTATTEIYTLSLHDALPISVSDRDFALDYLFALTSIATHLSRLAEDRSEEHTSELQSHSDLVCRLLLEKKKETSSTIDICCSDAVCTTHPQLRKTCPEEVAV